MLYGSDQGRTVWCGEKLVLVFGVSFLDYLWGGRYFSAPEKFLGDQCRAHRGKVCLVDCYGRM